MNLNGVQRDFLYRFRDAFAGLFISGKYPNSGAYKSTPFSNVSDVAAYFGYSRLSQSTVPNNPLLENGAYIKEVPYEIYFPYSENWDPQTALNYAVSYHPLSNVEWNYGMFYDAMGSPLYEVTVDDNFAYGSPTYIITYDDGLKAEDFSSGTPPIQAARYAVALTDDEYNPMVLHNSPTTPPTP
ncbi:MAG TPA: hypothetical protein PKD90_01065 [Phnomibacter sp.]|nr:hypothetical protein [Phnomibacter sp.]